MVTLGSANTLIQAMVPDSLRGRVMAVYSMMFMGMAPFGALLAGSRSRDDRSAAHRGHRRRRHPRGGNDLPLAASVAARPARTLIRYAASEPVPVPEVR